MHLKHPSQGHHSIPLTLHSTIRKTHLGGSHQAKAHHKATASQDESPGPKTASAMASGSGIIHNLLPKSKSCPNPAWGAPSAVVWGTRTPQIPAERDGALQEMCLAPPALAPVTAPSRQVTASREEPCTGQCQSRASTSFGMRWAPQKQSSRVCDCGGGDRKLAPEFLGCRRVQFPLGNESPAPGLAQEHPPIAPSSFPGH